MNKKFYSFGMAAMMLLLSGNVMATDYYISANGSDTNDGKSAATAWATMAKLSSALRNGDHVYVSGIIKMKNVAATDKNGQVHNNPEWSRAHLKDIVFEGTDPQKDGFDGEGENQLFNLNNSIYTFKNLSFKNGKLSIAPGLTGSNSYRGTDGQLVSGADTHAAAIWGSPLRLTLDNCIFENNISDEGNANFSAGAIYVGGNTVTNTNNEALNCGVYATNTQFINNSATVGQAGAIQLGTYGEFKNCYFNGNVAKMAGGAIHGNQLKGLTVDGCAFVGNQTQATGGAINFYLSNQKDLAFKVFNSTFYQNKSQNSGGAFNWNQDAKSENNVINFVHCTVVGNSTVGTIGHAGGINIESRACEVNVVNSLIQGNLAETNPNGYSDVTFGTTKVNIVGSYVGAVRKFTDFENNYTISSSSKVNDLGTKDPRKDESKALLAYADYVESLHFFPLKSTSDATMDGDATADAEYGVTKDQLGNAWSEFPYVGSVQLTDENVAAGISGIKTDAPKSLKGIYNIAGQYVGNDASKLAKGLYIIGGKKVVIK